MAQTRLKLIFDGDEKFLAMVVGRTFRWEMKNIREEMGLCLNFCNSS